MSKHSARRAARAVTLLLTAAVGLLLAHEGHAPLPTKGAQIDTAKGLVTLSKEARDALDLATADVQARPVEESVVAYATLVAPWQAHAFASSRLGGRVAKLYARPGQVVKAGEVLAEVKSLELETLQQNLLAAQNEARLAEQAVTVLEKSGGAVPEMEVISARSKRRQSLDALEVGRARWASLGLEPAPLAELLRTGEPTAASLPVRSPVAGTVVHADLAVGRVVEPAEHLFEVVDVTRVWAKVGVLEKDLHRVTAGQAVELRLPAYPGEAFRAAVSRVGLDLDPATHLGTAWCDLENPSGREPRLLPGMTGVARLLLPGPAKGVAVPEGALVEDGAESFVLVEEAAVAAGSQFLKRNVVPGRRAGGWVEVRPGGLFPGDRVVTRGSHQLGGFFSPGVLRPSPEAARASGLAVEPVGMRSIDGVLEIDGAVELPPSARGSASAHLGGTLVKVHADRGQRVRAGDVLAEVTGPEFLTLQLDLLRAHLEGLLLEDTFARLKRVSKGVARQQVIQAELHVLASRQTRAALRRKLLQAGMTDEAVRSLLEKKEPAATLPVRSPLDGVIVSFDRVLGQAVKAEEPLFTVHDLSRPLFVGHLSEREAALVRPGQRVRVRLNADPAFLAAARVARGGRVLGADSRTLAVWAEPDAAPAGLLRDGQLARLAVVLDGAPTTPVLAVPLAAVVRDGTRSFVFVKKGDGGFERRAVETGRADDLHVEVVRGLESGEPVAVRGAERLQTAYSVVR